MREVPEVPCAQRQSSKQEARARKLLLMSHLASVLLQVSFIHDAQLTTDIVD